MKFEHDIKLDYNDVLICPKRSILESRSEVSLHRRFKFKWTDYELSCVPIMASNMDTTGTIDMGNVLSNNGMITCVNKHDIQKKWPEEVWGLVPTVGMSQHDFKRLENFFKNNPKRKIICVDVANGYSQKLLEYVKRVRQTWPDKIIIAGNVVTREMTEALILAGADIVKVGIGPGSVCTTRRITGVGYPQLSAVIECADAAHGLGGHIIADGGCTCPGDIVKAFGAGADFVMLGGMLAGHDESAGEHFTDEDGNISHKIFYGMSSDTAMNKYNGGVASYRASEGKTVMVPYRGAVQETLQEITGGLRSACTYVGAKTIKELPKCTTFIRVNTQLNEIFGK